jgi:hypothetical protein
VKVVVDTAKPKGAGLRFVTALPVAAGAIVICLVTMGPIATLIVVACTAAAVPLLLRLLANMSFRRSNSSAQAYGSTFRAEASMQQTAGVMSISPVAVEWAPRRGSLAPVTLPVSEIAVATIAPVRALMVKAARLTFATTDGREIKMTATAPPEAVEAVLRSV